MTDEDGMSVLAPGEPWPAQLAEYAPLPEVTDEIPPAVVDITEAAMRAAAAKVTAIRPGVERHTAMAVIQALLVMGWRPPAVRS